MGKSADCARHLIAKHSHNLLSNKVREINVSRQVSISSRSRVFLYVKYSDSLSKLLEYIYFWPYHDQRETKARISWKIYCSALKKKQQRKIPGITLF